MDSVYKKVYDPLHGFIKLSEIESLFVDSLPFKRLHYIRQLGITYLVYPGATHTRYEHSLGVMQVATEIFDQVTSKIDLPFAPRDRMYFRQVLRLAALAHDLGHLPFSHVAEKNILGKGGHEKWTLKVLLSDYLQPIWQAMSEIYPDKDPRRDVIWISLGKNKLMEIDALADQGLFTSWYTVMSDIITGDYFGADRIDYLLRDTRCTGLSYGLFDYHQLMEMIRLVPSACGNLWQLAVEENGVESCEALILARHFMHKRVYQYNSVKTLSLHLSRFMHYHYQQVKPLDSLEKYLAVTDTDILFAIQQESKKGDNAHPDARCILESSANYDYILLPEGIAKESLIAHLQQQDIPIESLEWICAEPSRKNQKSFSVVKKTGEIIDAKRYSKILDLSLPVSALFCPKSTGAVVSSFLSRVSPSLIHSEDPCLRE